MKYRAWVLAGVAGLLVGCTSARSSPSATNWDFLGIKNLSAEQRAEIDTLRRDWQREALPKMARVRALNVEIHAMLASDNPDSKAIQERLDQVAGLLVEVQKAGLEMVLRVRKVLTPTQNRELQDVLMRQGEALFALEGPPGFLSPAQPIPAAPGGAGPAMAAPGPGANPPPGPAAGPQGPGGPGAPGPLGPAPAAGPVASSPMTPPPGGPAAAPAPGPETGSVGGPEARSSGSDPWAGTRATNPDQLRPCDGSPGPCRAACDAGAGSAPVQTRETGKKK